MSNKRTASSELNHDNWDQDYEPEEAGTFNRASDDVLKKRVFKTAKRRIAKGPDEGSLNVFNPANLAKFGPKAPQAPNEMFGFLSKIQTNVPKTNGISEKQEDKPKTSLFTFGNKTETEIKAAPSNATNQTEMVFSFGNPSMKNDKTPPTIAFNSENKSLLTNSGNKEDDEQTNLDNYYAKLKGLNQSVSKWINKHVEMNPLINLQPIFEDYQKFFNDIEKERDTNVKEKPAETFTIPKQPETKPTTTPIFKFGSLTSPLSENKEKTSNSTFSFAAKPSEAPSQKFSFGNANTSTPFSFGIPSATTPSINVTKSEENEESEEPPKVDVKQVEEEGHVYTIRCKLFVKKDGNYVEKGIGSLFLKPVPDSEKIQLIVRAHNSLGNVLCNFILSKSVPTQRTGKNNVMIVCIPTPDSQPPPVPILIRVKTEEDADQLLQTLEKHKK